MNTTALLIIYCLLILVASLVGGWVSLSLRLTHKRMELFVSFVAGVMLGVGLLHMLPHALLAQAMLNHADAHDQFQPVILWLLAGFLTMFFIERFFCFHHHEPPLPQLHDHSVDDHHHSHQHSHHPIHSRHKLTWTGAAIGLGIHSLIEGIALAASLEAARHDDHDHAALVGLGTFLVIFLHKPFDSLTLSTLMSIGGRSLGLRHLVNAAFGLLVPVGIALFYLGLVGLSTNDQRMISAALAFSAGTFLCIAMSDLLPELQFHQHDRGKLSVALLSGLALAWLISVLESRMH